MKELGTGEKEVIKPDAILNTDMVRLRKEGDANRGTRKSWESDYKSSFERLLKLWATEDFIHHWG